MNENADIVQGGAAIALLNILGYFIKVTPEIPNRFIPHILAAGGLVAECATKGWSLANAINGLILGLGAVGLNQAFRQSKQNDQPPTPPAQ